MAMGMCSPIWLEEASHPELLYSTIYVRRCIDRCTCAENVVLCRYCFSRLACLHCFAYVMTALERSDATTAVLH